MERRQRVILGAVFGGLLGFAITLLVGSIEMCSPNDSGACAMFVFVVVFLMAFVLGGMGLSSPADLALPWSAVAGHLLPSSLSLAIGAGINGALLGALIAFWRSKK